MTLRALIRRTLLFWANWKSRKAIHRALPTIRALSRQEAIYRAQHKRGSAKIIKAKRNAMSNALRGS